MTYADTDFFLALLKASDWLKSPAGRLAKEHAGKLWSSPATLIELLLLSYRLGLEADVVLAETLSIAPLANADHEPYLYAATLIKEGRANVFDALHAAFGGQDSIISSDKVFDSLGLTRIPLEKG